MTDYSRAFTRLAVVGIGCLTGVVFAAIGLKALFVSRGTFSDSALISGIFFVLLPLSLLGLVAPRLAGRTLAAVALLAGVALSIQERALPWGLWFAYTTPAV